MTAPILMTDCPTEETLASYLDNRLDHETRRKVTEHLASCGECREIVLMATDYQENEVNVRRGTFGSRRIAAAATAAGLAAAAALGFFVLRPALFTPTPTLDDVIEASRTEPHRPSIGRLSGGFPYQKEAPTYRGSNDGDSTDASVGGKLLAIAATLGEAKSPDPHVVGVTWLLIAKKVTEMDEAITHLDAAYQKERGGERDAISIDLAAALIARSRWRSENRGVERALDLSNDLLKRKQIPEAAWNRAVALQSLNRDAEAVRAWDEYLKLDPSSDWGKEAAERKAKLTQGY